MMALLLVSGVRTLTCRTVALSRALNTSSIQSFHSTVCAHRVFPIAARNRPVHFRSTSCSTLFVREPLNSTRQSCRCVTSSCSNNNVSTVFEEKTSEKCASLEQNTVIETTSGKSLSSIGETVVSAGQLDVRKGLGAEIKDTHSEEGVSAENTLSGEGASVVFASEEQSHSAIGVSSDVSQHQTDNTTVYCSDGTLKCTESAPVYFDNRQQPDAHTDNTTNTHVPGMPTVAANNNAVPVPAETPALVDTTTCQHLENNAITTSTTTTPRPTTTTTTSTASTQPAPPPPPPPALPPPSSFTLAPYLVHSQVLQGLVSLGVDLSRVEKVPEAAEHLLRADWARDIQPRLLFLRDLGVGVGVGAAGAGDSTSLSQSQSQSRGLGQVLNQNPLILKENVEEMKERVSYLESKKFSPEQITRIVTFAPLTLLLPVHYVDKKLGFLQNAFHLTGDEVRHVATKLPKIIPWKLQKLKDIRFYMKDMLGFSDKEMKNMLLASPRVYLSDRHQLGKRFDLLHNVMGLPHNHLATWPSVFRTRLHIIEQRHRFLVLKGRAQYDPRTESYVSLQALVSGTDRDFCEKVARAPTDQFYSFLRSL